MFKRQLDPSSQRRATHKARKAKARKAQRKIEDAIGGWLKPWNRPVKEIDMSHRVKHLKVEDLEVKAMAMVYQLP